MDCQTLGANKDSWGTSGRNQEAALRRATAYLFPSQSHIVMMWEETPMGKEGTGKRGKKCIERIEREGVYMGSKEERSTKTKAKCVAKMICFSRGALFLKYS